ncbi:hypothetical protein ADK41_05880 [Streptomyces caelestis]|uniref:Uncharacterized protein n=2 Tax=Streptomyces TaxID=1883 RepID=A0A0M8QTJ3_9ACTN|nr:MULTISPECIES: hypothetical protein [Streptomyces]KOT43673.1 hypothetical protein ADK41_05880 [Streptomyces caelestis]KOV25119.1 hypothetical protein ADK58_17125 [Streptomyces sp. XY152]
MKIRLRLDNAAPAELKDLENWLRAEPALRRVDLHREHAPTAPGDMGVMMDCLQLVLDDALLGALGQAIFDYWLSSGAFPQLAARPAEQPADVPALRVEWVDSADGSRSVTVEARDQETAEAVLRELPRAFGNS